MEFMNHRWSNDNQVMFFRQPSHAKYSENLIEYEITKLKNDEDVLNVLVQSNYWKRFCPIEILAIFSKTNNPTATRHVSCTTSFRLSLVSSYLCCNCIFSMFHYSRLSSQSQLFNFMCINYLFLVFFNLFQYY